MAVEEVAGTFARVASLRIEAVAASDSEMCASDSEIVVLANYWNAARAW